VVDLSEASIPNRLVEVPNDLYGIVEQYVLKGVGTTAPIHDYRRLIRLAYSRGYQDGYRNGHTDAENGHDERVRAVVS
jgi:hypothetical protein